MMLIPKNANTFKPDEDEFTYYNSGQGRNAQPQQATTVTPQAIAKPDTPNQIEQNFNATFVAGTPGTAGTDTVAGTQGTADTYSEGDEVTRRRAREQVDRSAQTQYDSYYRQRQAEVEGTPRQSFGDFGIELDNVMQRTARQVGWDLGGNIAATNEATRLRDAYSNNNFDTYYNRARQAVRTAGTPGTAGTAAVLGTPGVNATATVTPTQQQVWARGKTGAATASGTAQTVTGTPTGVFGGISPAQQAAINRTRGLV